MSYHISCHISCHVVSYHIIYHNISNRTYRLDKTYILYYKWITFAASLSKQHKFCAVYDVGVSEQDYAPKFILIQQMLKKLSLVFTSSLCTALYCQHQLSQTTLQDVHSRFQSIRQMYCCRCTCYDVVTDWRVERNILETYFLHSGCHIHESTS